ncbi:MAG: NYN domain-containing protein [Aquabacterium sp.]|jgi:uncharacterized LabA/DUF88 family protein|uniref:NYN domain-containing protein n=1 Tax=Aquabacterium sp. TaxID=1872578 RepID=UPI003BB1E945
MPQHPDHISMALFCDFENVALGVREANYDKFDIKKVLERLLLKGSIVVKKAYCDWERYRGFKGTMHEANFELIEIPHVRQSGKNSADIRMVVDALDLCYTKSHVNTFVIISGDSDFSPLVSKLRENAKHVIGVGVKQSTSDLLIANCDEFIFYDDLVRESQRNAARRDQRENNQPQQRRSPEEERRRREEMDARRTKIVELAAETYEALVTDRDDGGRIWASVLKEALKRRNPGFSESYFGFRTFGNLLEEAQSRGLLSFGRDEKSGTYVFRGTGQPVDPAAAQQQAPLNTTGALPSADEPTLDSEDTGAQASETTAESGAPRERQERTDRGDRNDRGDRHERGRGRGGRGGRGGNGQGTRQDGGRPRQDADGASQQPDQSAAPADAARPQAPSTDAPRRERRPFVEPAVLPRDDARAERSESPVAASTAVEVAASADQAVPKPARKTASRGTRKPSAKAAGDAAAPEAASAAPDQPATKAPARKTARKPTAKKAARTTDAEG